MATLCFLASPWPVLLCPLISGFAPGGPRLLTPPVGWSDRRAALACGRGGFASVGKVVGANDRATANLHFPGQPVESLASLPAAIDLRCYLLILRHERLVGLPSFTAAAVDAAGGRLPVR